MPQLYLNNLDGVRIPLHVDDDGNLVVADSAATTVPGVDSAGNTYTSEVVGNKSDTVAGTSLMAYLKLIESQCVTLVVPDADSIINVSMRDVVGNKDDTTAGTSLMAYLKLIESRCLVPDADSAANALVRDVVGNKNDTTAGTSLMAYAKLIESQCVTLAVPGADSTDNVSMRDVIGNKEDDASDTVDQASLVALLRKVIDEVTLIEEHEHNLERWWGALAVPDETNAIESNVTRPFAATSGNDAWGLAIPVVGTADNPGITGSSTTFDAHELLITDLDDDTTPWKVRLIYGTGTSADAITAGQWTERMVESNAVPGNRAGATPVKFRMIVLDVGTKLWAQAWNDTNGEILSFFVGCHGYPAPHRP